MSDTQVMMLVLLSGLMLLASVAVNAITLYWNSKGLRNYMDTRFSHVDSLLAKRRGMIEVKRVS